LSFKSLNDLASRPALWSDVAWLWPLTVDMTILSTTMAIVALAGYADQGRNRRFFWALLVFAAMISVGGNARHRRLHHQRPRRVFKVSRPTVYRTIQREPAPQTR